MLSVHMFEAKTTLSQLVARVLAGEEIAVGKYGKPLVKIIPLPQANIVHALAGKGDVGLSTDEIMAMSRGVRDIEILRVALSLSSIKNFCSYFLKYLQ